VINIGVGVALVALSTLCTAIMIGLGFLSRPSRATATWSFSFALAMIAAYGWVASDSLESPWLRGMCAGLMLGASTFIWVGLRARRDAPRSHGPIAAIFTATVSTLLAVTAMGEYYGLVFRIVFATGAIFAGFTLAELARLRPLLRDVALPLLLASGAFVVFGVVSLIEGITQYATTGTLASRDGLQLIRDINSMASLVYLVCALVSLLLLARRGSAAAPALGQSPFRVVAEDRLLRARAADDRWWSVLDIRLDDPIDIREATSTDAFERVAARFADDVRASLPPDADLERRGSSGFVALLPRPEGAVRQVLARLLEAVALPDPDQPIAVRLSASIGWATVDTAGYELDELLAAASAAATAAQRAGGDRWEAAGVPVVG
jgi:GGDEF domain-containing protein